MSPEQFFSCPNSTVQKQYEALRLFYVEKVPAAEVAKIFGYTYRGFTTIASDFRILFKNNQAHDFFFVNRKLGRKRVQTVENAKIIIVKLRNANHSVEEIKTVLDSKGINISEKTVYNILKELGFDKLPRRNKETIQKGEIPTIKAEKSEMLTFDENEEFKSSSCGILCLMPYIEKYGIREIIEECNFPGTKTINSLDSILSFVSLKSSNIRRYTADNIWCMDRGMGMFAGLNVLPKAAWYSSYSHRVTSDMNKMLLSKLHKKWLELGLLSDTVNLDFTTIPYWGNSDHLENNWSGKRTKALASMLAVLAQDPDSGIVDYGDTNILHKNESSVILEFLDFYKNTGNVKQDLKYLVFDSKFTNYQNLSKLNESDIKFITIRRRGKNIVEKLENTPDDKWKKVRVDAGSNKSRTLYTLVEEVPLRGYNGTVRQISITGNGKIKPAILITNDFELSVENIVRKYARRWLIEKEISEQISFFHLNNVSSSMVIKVDFDLTMSILTHNLYRLLAMDLTRYENSSDQKLYEHFLLNSADIEINQENIIIKLKKKRNLPLMLETMNKFNGLKIPWLDNKTIIFQGATYS